MAAAKPAARKPAARKPTARARKPAAPNPVTAKPPAKKKGAANQRVTSHLTAMFGVVRRIHFEMVDGSELVLPVTGRILLEAGRDKSDDPAERTIEEGTILALARLLRMRWIIDRDPRGALSVMEVADTFVGIDYDEVQPVTNDGDEVSSSDERLDPTEGGAAPSSSP